MLGALQGAATLRDFCQGAAEEVRRVTGFARVMIYRFNQDDSGHVFAESRREGIGSYLDLHYPASDISRPGARPLPPELAAPDPRRALPAGSPGAARQP